MYCICGGFGFVFKVCVLGVVEAYVRVVVRKMRKKIGTKKWVCGDIV